jgi:glycosyltransferase involved in cell wall biosynthesis
VDLSVIIPSYQRPEKLRACLAALARQTLDPARFEVLVGLDGPDADSGGAAADAWREAGGSPGSLVVAECPRQGLNATRNRVLKRAQGRYLVSLNDDVLAAPEFLAAHLAAHHEFEAAAGAGEGCIVSGYSPFRVFENDSIFDRLVRETSMIFFYDRMLAPDADRSRDWGFRHCWGLNFSAPLAMVREVGGFIAVPLAYGYDDIELAHRLHGRFATPVLFRPEARADHDHRYHPAEVLEREERLGQSAWHFAGAAPEFSRAVFGRDLRCHAELHYSREFVQREAAGAARLEQSFLALSHVPAWSLRGEHAPALLNVIFEQHLMLKRSRWRTGLLAAAEGTAR